MSSKPQSPSRPVRVHVRPAAGGLAVGHLSELSPADALVLLPLDTRSSVPVGTEVDLDFCEGSGAPFATLRARGLVACDGAELREMRFELVARGDRRPHLPRALWELMERRGTARLTLHPDVAVAARLRAEGEEDEHTGLLLDLSPSGLSVRLQGGAEGVLAGVERAHIELDLPGRTDPVHVVGWIRNRRWADRAVLYGIELDLLGSPEQEAARAAIADYLIGLLTADAA